MSSNEWGILTIPTQADPEQRAIYRLRIASEMSLKNYGTPLVVTTSGGKDSSACGELALRGGIPFEVQHNHTTADAPETVRFVRQEFARLESLGVKCTIHHPTYKGKRTSMWSLIPQKLMPPTRLMRYCCSVLKENSCNDRMIATGVRWAESTNRAKKRGIFEKQVSNKDKAVSTRNDSDSLAELFAPCKLKAKRVVNPIVDWSDADVWDFLHDAKVPVNPLYECGFSRVGCIGCPMAGKKRYAEFRRWPAYEKLYIQAFDRMLDERRARGKLDGNGMMGDTGQDVFRWWMEEDVLPGQMSVEDFA
ncbi:MAG: phosphoadenosine phosphosulfate reductase family protein [Subdoligranulum variabile]|nr:phosphoadenosine phosphosulfate reductase family protein [Subdoligranulum variabile]